MAVGAVVEFARIPCFLCGQREFWRIPLQSIAYAPLNLERLTFPFLRCASFPLAIDSGIASWKLTPPISRTALARFAHQFAGRTKQTVQLPELRPRQLALLTVRVVEAIELACAVSS
jgi:hypothetical protein